VINAGIQHVLDEINASKTLVQTVQSLLGLGFLIDVPIALALELGTIAFNIIQTLNLTDLQSGLSDSTYFDAVMCAIFVTIESDGQITADNWAAVQAAIDAVTAPNAATGSAVSSYVDNMDANAALFLQQQGPIYEGDCSSCMTWFHDFDFLTAFTPWTFPFGSGNDGHWTSGTGVVADNDSGTWWIEILVTFSARVITKVEGGVIFHTTAMSGASGCWVKAYSGATLVHELDFTVPNTGTVQNFVDEWAGSTCDSVRIRLRSTGVGGAATVLQGVTIHGQGTDPF